MNNSGTFEHTPDESDENNESPSRTLRALPPRFPVNKKKKIRNRKITEENAFLPLEEVRKRAEKRAEQNLKKRSLEDEDNDYEDDDDDYENDGKDEDGDGDDYNEENDDDFFGEEENNLEQFEIN